jgi:hypothetical protein
MGVDITLNNVGNGYNRSAINDNFEAIEEAFSDALSVTDGGTMQTDIDLNSNDLLNVGTIDAEVVTVDGVDISATLNAAVAAAQLAEANAELAESNAEAAEASAESAAAASAVSAAEAAASAAAALAAAESNERLVTLGQFGADPTGTVDSSVAIQAAIDYAYAQGGATIKASAGTYLVGTQINMKENVAIEGEGSLVTEFRRTANITVFKHDGPSYEVSSTIPWYGASLRKLDVRSASNYTATMVDYIGATYLDFEDVRILGVGCTLLSLLNVWDSRFTNCEFHEGGTADGVTPSVLFRGGYGYYHSKELFFQGCVWENYAGKAIGVDAEDSAHRPHMIGFNQCKFESIVSQTVHVDLNDTYLLWFDEMYITSAKVPDTVAVMELGTGSSYAGSLTFAFSVGVVGFTAPKSCVKLVDATYVNLNITLHSQQPATTWAVDWDSNNETNTVIDIVAPYPYVNGRYALGKDLLNSLVRIKGVDANDVVGLNFEKTGRIPWSFGRPSNPSSTNEDIALTADGTSMITFRSSTATPSTARRAILTNGVLEVGGGSSSNNLLKMGTMLLWFDAQSKLRRTSESGTTGKPASDTSGFYFITNSAGTTAARPVTGLEIGQQYFDTTLSHPIWWNGTVWKDGVGTTV